MGAAVGTIIICSALPADDGASRRQPAPAIAPTIPLHHRTNLWNFLVAHHGSRYRSGVPLLRRKMRFAIFPIIVRR